MTNLYDDDNDIWIRTVYFLDPYDASKNPEYYIYESGDSYITGRVVCDDIDGTLDVDLELRSSPSIGWIEADSISGVLTLNSSCPSSPSNPWQGYIKVAGYILTPEYYDYTGAVYGGGKIIPNSYRYFDQSPCSGDLDGDGDTDQSDLAILLGAYDSTCRGDLDGDGDTDQSDLGILTADYGC